MHEYFNILLGTVFRLCILVKNCHLGFKKAPVDSTFVASLKSYLLTVMEILTKIV